MIFTMPGMEFHAPIQRVVNCERSNGIRAPLGSFTGLAGYHGTCVSSTTMHYANRVVLIKVGGGCTLAAKISCNIS